MCRRPNLDRFVISKSRDNLTALSCVRRLRVELLETEKKDLDLVEILDGPDGFESRLHDRRNILAEAEAQPNATAETITAALLDELRKIRASGQSAPLPSNADGAPAPLDESRLVAVLTGSDNAVFRTITAALSGLDLGTPSGQRDALTIGYDGKCVATVRVLFCSLLPRMVTSRSCADTLRSASSTNFAIPPRYHSYLRPLGRLHARLQGMSPKPSTGSAGCT